MIGQLADGQMIGDYDVVSVAGEGGMGIVYRATQRSLGRIVALKVIREEIARTPEYRERFLREARLAASVDHPHIVSVYDVGEQVDRLYLAMQWVEGEDLKRLIARSGRLEPARAVAIAGQLAGALDALHGVGLVHRDIKPANMLLRQVGGKDHAYVTDFGIAKPADTTDQLTQTGWVVGTTGYLSPEQIMGHDPGPRSDLYALGCVFFETLTGKPPFARDNEMAMRWAHANDPRPRASDALAELGPRYDGFLARALAVEPGQRFSTGREFADALNAADAEQVTTQLPPRAPRRAQTAVGPPTPLPPMQTPAPVNPGYGYATPPPAYPGHARSGNPLALILLGLVALAGIAVGALAAAGVFSHNSSGTPAITSTPAARKQSAPASTAASASGANHSCGGDLSAGPHTTCAFARNVEQAYLQSTGGTTDVVATSPSTGQTYTMHCTGGSPHVCTGGNGASVNFTSSPAPNNSPPNTPPPTSVSMRACDQNISANTQTSCDFAANVFKQYASDYKANGVQSDDRLVAYSPSNNQSYPMDCTTDGTTVNCTGANNAFVTYPLWAVKAY